MASQNLASKTVIGSLKSGPFTVHKRKKLAFAWSAILSGGASPTADLDIQAISAISGFSAGLLSVQTVEGDPGYRVLTGNLGDNSIGDTITCAEHDSTSSVAVSPSPHSSGRPARCCSGSRDITSTNILTPPQFIHSLFSLLSF